MIVVYPFEHFYKVLGTFCSSLDSCISISISTCACRCKQGRCRKHLELFLHCQDTTVFFLPLIINVDCKYFGLGALTASATGPTVELQADPHHHHHHHLWA